MSNNPSVVGVIGLGLLGSALAERLIRSGFRVVGFDVDASRREALAARGGLALDSAQAVAEQSPRILLSLPNSNIARGVIDEVRSVLPQGAIVIDTTTGDPAEMAALGDELSAYGIAYVDATVGGSSQQARERDVIVMAGGEQKSFDACRDVFDTFARETFYVGPCGSGATMKLVVNLVLGLNRAALAEGLAFARSLGLDLAETLKVLQAGPAWSRAMDVKGKKMIAGNFEPQARLSQHLKDVKLILAAGEATGARLPLSELHRRLLEDAERQGFGDADNSAIIKAFE